MNTVGAYFALSIAVLPIAWFLFPYFVRRISTMRLRRLCRAQKIIILSYDDGPSSQLSQRLLKVLSSSGVKATFFVLGRNLISNKDVVNQYLDAGHEIGSHTYAHSNAWKTDPFTATRDLSKGLNVVQNVGGDTRLFRPPYGKLTLATMLHSVLSGFRFCWWTIDTRDTRNRVLTEDVIAQLTEQRGGVVLMHDLDKPTQGEDEQSHGDYVIELTQKIIEFANQKGYRLMRIGDLDKLETS